MTLPKIIMISAIIILSLSVGYFKGKAKIAAMVGLGVMCAFYVAIFLAK